MLDFKCSTETDFSVLESLQGFEHNALNIENIGALCVDLQSEIEQR